MQKARPVSSNRAGFGCSVPKSSDPGSRHQKQPFERQHFLKRLPEPQGQRSFRPSFSSSSLPPLTTRTPRLTCVSDGYPRRRLLIVSKKMAVRRTVRDSCVPWRTSGSVDVLLVDTSRRKRFTGVLDAEHHAQPSLSRTKAGGRQGPRGPLPSQRQPAVHTARRASRRSGSMAMRRCRWRS